MSQITSKLQAIVLAAGKGTRMKSELPKVLHRVCGITLLERTLQAVAELGPQRIVVVIGYGEELLRAELKLLQEKKFLKGIELRAVLQAEQLGTGHAAQVALPELDPAINLVLIVPGDTPLIRKETFYPFEKVTQEVGSAELMFLTGKPEKATGFGRVIRDASQKIVGIVEEKDATAKERDVTEVNCSFYLAQLPFLKSALSSLRAENAQREYYLTDIVSYGAKNKYQVLAAAIENFDFVAGANSRSELSVLETKRRNEINRSLMDAGVTFENPAVAYIDEGVEVGTDAFIGAGTRLKGKTQISPGAILDGDSLIVDSLVGVESHIKLGCVIESSVIGSECSVGPYAHLRPGTILETKVKIGNFVETKNTKMGQGSKANHLSYVGDATVGPHANIGAGTITCNYDGVNKHKTVVHEGAFIGSNTSLVAPVEVGVGAVVGAGSVITKDIPAGALAVERSEQKNIEGWAEKRSAKKKK